MNDHKKNIMSLQNILITPKQYVDKILLCNQETIHYGLSLNEKQALALVETCHHVLNKTRRIELTNGIIHKLIQAFCTSPYISKENYESTLHELIDLFYETKNETWDLIDDNDLISFMKEAFNQRCHGSIDILNDEIINLIVHIHEGGLLDNYQSQWEEK